MKVEIKRETWAVAQTPSDNALANRDGTFCCLGFLGLACGIPREEMLDKSYPSQLLNKGDHRFPRAVLRNLGDGRSVQAVLAEINDRKDFSNEEREDWIAAGFRFALGIEVEFTGSYPETSP